MTEEDESDIPKSRLRAVASVLKIAYEREKRLRIGSAKFYFSKKHDKSEHWNKVAANCIRLNADPDTYMRAAFTKCTMQFGPYPNALAGVAATGWYNSYVRSIGTKAEDIRQPHENLVDAVERKELSDAIKSIRSTLKNMNGSWLPTEVNVEWLLRYSSPVPDYLRALLCYPVEEVRIRYGESAHAYFVARPQLIHAAKKLGYPIDDILVWLSQR